MNVRGINSCRYGINFDAKQVKKKKGHAAAPSVSSKNKINKGAALLGTGILIIGLQGCSDSSENKSNFENDIIFDSSEVQPANNSAHGDYTTSVDTNNQPSSARESAVTFEPVDNYYAEKTRVYPVDVRNFYVPVSEMYLEHDGEIVVLTAASDIVRNNRGNAVITISDRPSSDKSKGCTLREITGKAYGDDLAPEVFNKVIDEIIQTNPELGEFFKTEFGVDGFSYEKAADVNLQNNGSIHDEFMEVKGLYLPQHVVYQKQQEYGSLHRYSPVQKVYKPKNDVANIGEEYKNIEEMIRGEYGNLSNEAFRDVLFAIVNHPDNAGIFEENFGSNDIKAIIESQNIDDVNRVDNALSIEKADNIILPVAISSVTLPEDGTIVNEGDKDAIIFQISPSGDKSSVLLKDKKGAYSDDDVYQLADILRFYSSPDGLGKFAEINNERITVNLSIPYAKEFCDQILIQTVYANKELFAAKYEDFFGDVHEYGVFDPNPGFNAENASVDEIIANSSINMERVYNYSLVNLYGFSNFAQGTHIVLPQFAVRINDSSSVVFDDEIESDEAFVSEHVTGDVYPDEEGIYSYTD